MDWNLLLFIIVLLATLGSGLWIALALLLTGLTGLLLFTKVPILAVLSETIWTSSTSWELVSLPLFIWMGEILSRSRISEKLFSALAPWLHRVPGRLYHVNVLAAGLFAAVSGSSTATCATVAQVTLPKLRARGYDRSLALGSIAGAGTLGILIPPSVAMIVYAVTAQQSIARLFIAGIGPALLIIILYSSYIALVGRSGGKTLESEDHPISFKEKLFASKDLLPVIILIVGIMGGIYGGIASPTDAAAVGVVLALVLVWWQGDLRLETIKEGLFNAALMSGLLTFILLGAALLTKVMAYSGIPAILVSAVLALKLEYWQFLTLLTIGFTIMGCFLDGMSIVVLTTAVLYPAIVRMGVDPIWFGVYLIIIVEIGLITPPVGLNLFVLQGITGESLFRIARASVPFFLLLWFAIACIALFPQIALWLPGHMG